MPDTVFEVRAHWDGDALVLEVAGASVICKPTAEALVDPVLVSQLQRVFLEQGVSVAADNIDAAIARLTR